MQHRKIPEEAVGLFGPIKEGSSDSSADMADWNRPVVDWPHSRPQACMH